ncbi:MAG: hypothetical protein ACI90V_005522, partial [Bacillariaceae sp.]|jgi:hypothetical protein
VKNERLKTELAPNKIPKLVLCSRKNENKTTHQLPHQLETHHRYRYRSSTHRSFLYFHSFIAPLLVHDPSSSIFQVEHHDIASILNILETIFVIRIYLLPGSFCRINQLYREREEEEEEEEVLEVLEEEV